METEQTSEIAGNEKTVVWVCYILFAASMFFGGFPALIGVIVAHIKLSSTRGTTYGSHYRNLIGAFWFSLLISFVGVMVAGVLTLLIGLPILLVALGYFIIKVLRGMLLFHEGKPYPGL